MDETHDPARRPDTSAAGPGGDPRRPARRRDRVLDRFFGLGPDVLAVIVAAVAVIGFSAQLFVSTGSAVLQPAVDLSRPVLRLALDERVLLEAGATIEGPVPLTVTTLPLWGRLLVALPILLQLLPVAVALWNVAPVLRDVRAGRPFAGSAPRRLGIIAVAMSLLVVVEPVTNGLAAWAVSRELGEAARDALSWFPQLSLSWLVLAILALSARQAAVAGRRLADDVEGLV